MTSSQPSRVRRNAATPCRFRTGSISHSSMTDYVFDAESGRLVPRDLTRVYWESATYQAMHGSDDLTKLFKPPEPFPYLVPTGESPAHHQTVLSIQSLAVKETVTRKRESNHALSIRHVCRSLLRTRGVAFRHDLVSAPPGFRPRSSFPASRMKRPQRYDPRVAEHRTTWCCPSGRPRRCDAS